MNDTQLGPYRDWPPLDSVINRRLQATIQRDQQVILGHAAPCAPQPHPQHPVAPALAIAKPPDPARLRAVAA